MSARRLHYTYAQYLTLEEQSPVRHEYLDGEIYAMAAGSPDHAAHQGLVSLREVLFVSHRGPQLTLHRREKAGWLVLTAGPGESLELASLAARIAVDEVYRDGLEDAG